MTYETTRELVTGKQHQLRMIGINNDSILNVVRSVNIISNKMQEPDICNMGTQINLRR